MLSVAVLLALVWALWWRRPSEGMLYVSAGLSLLVMDGLYVKRRILGAGASRPARQTEADSSAHDSGRMPEPVSSPAERTAPRQHQQAEVAETPTDGSMPDAPAVIPENGGFGYAGDMPLSPNSTASALTANSTVRRHRLSATDVFAEPRDRFPGTLRIGTGPVGPSDGIAVSDPTGPLPQDAPFSAAEPADATVLLESPSGGRIGMQPFHGILLIRKGGRQSTVAWTGEPRFVIGHGPHQVHYPDDSLGVSRLYAEFVREGERYFVKDLGSRNGTLLNGEPMLPHKPYELADGDCVKIIRTEIVFRK